jgi:DNA-binding beta-propeller fold protein YncE
MRAPKGGHLTISWILILLSSMGADSDGGAIAHLNSERLPLPGAPGPILMDYVAYDGGTGRLWVPAGNTGQVNVIETATRRLEAVKGFPTVTRNNRTIGPTSATVGEGFVYIGNRADSSVCAVESRSLKLGACVQLEALPDGIAYVSTTKEIWVTAPRDKALIVLDASAPVLKVKTKLPLEGQPEGYAVDEKRGILYSNLEDKDLTLGFEVRSRKIISRFEPKCGTAGPRGIVLDEQAGHVFVACTDGVVSLSARDGSHLGQAKTGSGVDNIDYLPSRRLLYVASGKTARLMVFRVTTSGSLQAIASAETAPGARVVMVDKQGTAFVPDSAGGQLFMVRSPN